MAGNTVSYKCPSCGAPIGYIPSTDKIVCEYCGTAFKIETLDDIYDKEQAQAAKNRAAKEAKWHTEEAGSEWSEEELAHMHALSEFEKYRVVQDRLYESDFDRFILPEEIL